MHNSSLGPVGRLRNIVEQECIIHDFDNFAPLFSSLPLGGAGGGFNSLNPCVIHINFHILF